MTRPPLDSDEVDTERAEESTASPATPAEAIPDQTDPQDVADTPASSQPSADLDSADADRSTLTADVTPAAGADEEHADEAIADDTPDNNEGSAAASEMAEDSEQPQVIDDPTASDDAVADAIDEEASLAAVGALPAPPPEILTTPPEVAAPAPVPPELSPEAAQRAALAARRQRLHGFPVTAHAVVLTVLVAGVFLMFLLIEPTQRWIALFGAAVAALGTEGVLRAARREPFASGLDTTPFLFLPALFALATPVFLEHNAPGYWAVPAGLAAAVAFGVVVLAEVASVRPYDPAHGIARFITAAGTYFVAFALFSLSYDFDLGTRPALAAVGLGGVLLAIEMLREGEVDPQETLVLSVVTGLLLAEARWTLRFMPLDGYLAGLALVFVFFLLSGILHAYVTRALDRAVALQHAVITALGIALVVGARATGIA